MKYKRIFAFGCSFTNFNWPTWPYVLEKDLNIPMQNWGICGLGNVGIMNRMIECDIKNTFTSDDLIVVLWSTWHREDRYLGHWTMSGNIFNDEILYDKSFRNKFWDIENDIIKNAGAIIGANKMFNIQSQANILEPDNDTDTVYSKEPIFQFYAPYLPTDTFPWADGFPQRMAYEGYLTIDNHPDVAAHVKYVQEFIYKDIGLTMKQETIDHFAALQEKIVNLGKDGKMKEMKIWSDLDPWFKKHTGFQMKNIGFPK